MTYVYVSGQLLAVPKFNTRILRKGNKENKTINLKIKCLLTRVSSLSFFHSVFATHILLYDTYYTPGHRRHTSHRDDDDIFWFRGDTKLK